MNVIYNPEWDWLYLTLAILFALTVAGIIAISKYKD